VRAESTHRRLDIDDHAFFHPEDSVHAHADDLQRTVRFHLTTMATILGGADIQSDTRFFLCPCFYSSFASPLSVFQLFILCHTKNANALPCLKLHPQSRFGSAISTYFTNPAFRRDCRIYRHESGQPLLHIFTSQLQYHAVTPMQLPCHDAAIAPSCVTLQIQHSQLPGKLRILLCHLLLNNLSCPIKLGSTCPLSATNTSPCRLTKAAWFQCANA